MAKVKQITAREILDSRGIPTLEGMLVTDSGQEIYAQVPSGESLGSHEGIEIRDKNEQRYVGMGVQTAVRYINEAIAPKLVGIDVDNLSEVDAWLVKADGTKNSSKLGVNTIMVVSQLFLKAGAEVQKMPLYKYVNEYYNHKYATSIKLNSIPTPIYNMINGGKHGTKNLDFQEFHIVTSSSTPYSQSLEFAVSAYNGLKELFNERNADVSVSEEGGFTPSLFTNTEAFEIIKEILISKKIRVGVDVFTGADCAPNYYYDNGKYAIKDQPGAQDPKEYLKFIMEIVEKYNLIIIEDPIHEDDYESWSTLTQEIGKQAYVVADDFVAGNRDRLQKAIKKNACNAVLVKFNQVGTVTEMLALIHAIKEAGMKLVVSHRLGETVDSTIADLAVGVQADFVKFGSPARGERIAKYNRLLKIESDLGFKIVTKPLYQTEDDFNLTS